MFVVLFCFWTTPLPFIGKSFLNLCMLRSSKKHEQNLCELTFFFVYSLNFTRKSFLTLDTVKYVHLKEQHQHCSFTFFYLLFTVYFKILSNIGYTKLLLKNSTVPSAFWLSLCLSSCTSPNLKDRHYIGQKKRPKKTKNDL